MYGGHTCSQLPVSPSRLDRSSRTRSGGSRWMARARRLSAVCWMPVCSFARLLTAGWIKIRRHLSRTAARAGARGGTRLISCTHGFHTHTFGVSTSKQAHSRTRHTLGLAALTCPGIYPARVGGSPDRDIDDDNKQLLRIIKGEKRTDTFNRNLIQFLLPFNYIGSFSIFTIRRERENRSESVGEVIEVIVPVLETKFFPVIN